MLSLEHRIARVVAGDHPSACCDGCLALDVGASLEEVRLAAVAIVLRSSDLHRKVRPCDRCGRTLEMTCKL
jgi:hypothetical protein